MNSVVINKFHFAYLSAYTIFIKQGEVYEIEIYENYYDESIIKTCITFIQFLNIVLLE